MIIYFIIKLKKNENILLYIIMTSIMNKEMKENNIKQYFGDATYR